MIVTVWKNEKESNERCITRFTKAVQASRKTLKLRQSRYHKKKMTKVQERQAAIAREGYRASNAKNKFY